METAIIFGGSGYIGSNLARRLSSENRFKNLVLADIKKPKSPLPANVCFKQCDVRNPIFEQLGDIHPDWIFNFAAVHREPGHKGSEYFDTNISGARNVCKYAETVKCQNILFTSSISVYGPTVEATTENSPKYPKTPYGISKLCAELIHECWYRSGNSRKLIICRPGVVYGPGDPGNILRMIKAVQKGYFFFPGTTKIRKSYAYIEGLIDSFVFAISYPDSLFLYNYVEKETETIGGLIQIVKQELSSSSPVIAIPLWVLLPFAHGIQFLTNGKSPIHPERVKKAAFPTHIVPFNLEQVGFNFKYDFRSSLKDWISSAPEDFFKGRNSLKTN